MTRKLLLVVLLASFCAAATTAQTSGGPPKGTLILTGGDQETGVKEFVSLAGGPDANIVYIPTAASSLRLPSGVIWEWLYADALPANTPEFKRELCKMFGVKDITILHTRNQQTANSKEFVEPLRKAHGVWLSGGWRKTMKRIFTAAAMIAASLIPAQGQAQANAGRNEPPVDCAAYPAQPTSLYVLPWRAGESYEIIRTTSHYTRGNRGVGLSGIDIRMPIGTTVVAARAGIVVAVKEDFADGNGVDLQENYVFIKHADGTVGRYFHLTRRGALVEVGDSVRQGDVIARSGNSGDSGEPHLHFDVQVCGVNLPPNYNQLPCGQTLPVTFRNTDPHACGLIPGRSYVARRFNIRPPGPRRPRAGKR